MTRIKDIAQGNLAAVLVATFLVGVFIGLVVLGWGVWPVQWVGNARPADLQEAYRRAYLEMVAESYAVTGDAETARSRLEAAALSGQSVQQVARELEQMGQARISAGDIDGGNRLQALASVITSSQPGAEPATGALPSPPRAPQPLLTRLLRVFGLVILVLVCLAGLLLLVYFLQSRTTAEEPLGERVASVAAVEPRPAPPTAPPAQAATARPAPPDAVAPAAPAQEQGGLGRFVATYNLGDVDYDMSFGIESPLGDFLGECGLGMAETVGSGGDVQRVTAFEVWLFDKTDIRTVSIVLASAHAYSDAALRTKLASRGEMVQAEVGRAFSVQTSTLRLDGRILDMAYGGGDLPAQSYFTSFSVELTPVLLTGEESA
ncbi:MAG: hypothetical protein K6V36_12675 [Anaerolineae bacterium]|nr:hypothetical protein [Anaerolineae bacterium]